mgnify:CR=1 FL=1
MSNIATKDQERRALAQIKKIVEGLGPDSYIGTAFKGVFEDAEQDIEYDTAYSMKERLESAEVAEQHLRETLAAANERLGELGGLIDKLKEQLRQKEVELAQSRLPKWLLEDLRAFTNEEGIIARKQMEATAERMAVHAEHPETVAFKEAVEGYRKAQQRRGRCEKNAVGLDELASQE